MFFEFFEVMSSKLVQTDAQYLSCPTFFGTHTPFESNLVAEMFLFFKYFPKVFNCSATSECFSQMKKVKLFSIDFGIIWYHFLTY